MSQKHHQTWDAESCAILIIANVRLNDCLCLPGVWRLANSCSLLSSSSLSPRQYYLHYLHLTTLSTLYLLIICMGCNMDLTLGIGHHGILVLYTTHHHQFCGVLIFCSMQTSEMFSQFCTLIVHGCHIPSK